MEQTNTTQKNITHQLFEMVDGLSDKLSDKNIKDLKEKIGEVHHVLDTQSKRIKKLIRKEKRKENTLSKREQRKALRIIEKEIARQNNM